MKASEIASTAASQAVTCEVGEVDVVPTALFGWSLTEAVGSTASVRVLDGADVTGAVLSGLITLNANESTRDFPPVPIDVVSGALYLQVVSGTVEACVYWG